MSTNLAEEKQNSYQAAFNELQQRSDAAGMDWLKQLRARAMEQFAETGFPSVRDEEWKYTNVAAIAKSNFQPTFEVSAIDNELKQFIAAQGEHANQLVLIDGVLNAEHSHLNASSSELTAIRLAEAIVDHRHKDTVRAHLGREADYVANSFTALNTAFANEGVYLQIPKGMTVNEPIHLLLVATREAVATFPRILIVAEEQSTATIMENYVAARAGKYFTSAVVEVVVKDSTRLEHFKVQRESTNAFHVANTAVDLGRSAVYDSTTITFGASLSRHDLSVTMNHEGAHCTVDGLYLVTGDQHADTHSVIDHRMPRCSSRQLYKGILDGKSRAVFNGKVFVRHNAQQTDAMQTNKNLLLSNDARVDTKPQLEILADDVKCAHGAAVGQISEEELFYLETRGIHTDLARNLLTYGFAEEVIEKIKVESIRKQLDEAVLSRLNARLEA
ncbi:MAG TPA: Fe-S cluster assembly protein SufD [Pyrinomonadaceae bacterium]|nr:Fe-S cluster assembly protein SufD [Pyrinomonadaceae bacterium]